MTSTMRVLAMDSCAESRKRPSRHRDDYGPTAYLLRHEVGCVTTLGDRRDWAISVTASFCRWGTRASPWYERNGFRSGYNRELSDLEALRTLGSRAPGPSRGEQPHSPGVETMTGPGLGKRSATPSAWRWPPAASAACWSPTLPEGAGACSTTRSLGVRLGRRPRAGRQLQGVVVGLHSRSRGNWSLFLRRQPDLDRGQHGSSHHRGRRHAVSGPAGWHVSSTSTTARTRRRSTVR